MFWYWIWRERRYVLHPHGIARYAEKTAAVVSAYALEQLEKTQREVHDLLIECQRAAILIEQKWNKLCDLGNASNPLKSPVTPEEYEDLNLRVARGRWVFFGLLLGEGFLNYLALLIVLPGDEPLMLAARAAIALILTLVAFKVFHFALRAWDPARATETGDVTLKSATAALAAVTLVSIAGVSIARARDFEGGAAGIGIVGWGFILASLILPVVGGVVDVELARIQPQHRSLRKWRNALKALRTFEGHLQADVTRIEKALEGVKTEVKQQSERFYAGVIDFRVYKDNRDARGGLFRKITGKPEELDTTLANSEQAFLTAALAEFETRLEEYKKVVSEERTQVAKAAHRSRSAGENKDVDDKPAAAQPTGAVATASPGEL